MTDSARRMVGVVGDVPYTQPSGGPLRPLAATPPLRPASVRRTSSIDVPWPDIDADRAAVLVRGRDVRVADTGESGEPRVVASLALDLVTELASGRVLDVSGPTDIDIPADLSEALVGASLRAGFSRHLATALGSEVEQRTLAYSALDDLPGGYLVAGYSLLRAGMIDSPPGSGAERAQRQGDVCIGWAVGSPVHEVLLQHDTSATPFGPAAPALEAAEPAGWHDLPPLAPGTVRRRRQVDVWVADGGLAVQSHFRDSYVADDHEMVMHEYLVQATVDGDGRLASIDVDPRALPWAECPGAAASAGALVGTGLDDLGARVRAELVGPSTCTHLNSTLRALADVSALRP